MKTEFTFMSKDGRTPVHAVKWIPETGNCRAVLQITHGMTEFIERYEPFAEFLAEHDILVVGHDHIGHGQSVLTKKDWGYFAPGNASRILVQDMHQLRRIIRKQYKDIPYFMLGHSMGSFLLRRYLASRGKGLNGAIIMGTGFTEPRMSQTGVFLADVLSKIFGWHHRSGLLTKIAFGTNKRFDMTGENPHNSWLTKDSKIAKWYYEQPACTYIFTLNGYRTLFDTVKFTCLQENVDRIHKKLPVLIISGEDDGVGDYGKGVKKVSEMFKKAGIKDLRTVLYKGDRHEILNEVDREMVFADILDWIEARI